MNRRFFMKELSAIAAGMIGSNGMFSSCSTNQAINRKIKISNANLKVEREPLIRPLGFKGGFINELWQSICCLTSESGIRKIGTGTQSILWSDSSVFVKHSESEGNSLMLAITERALSLIKGKMFRSPIDLLDSIYDELYDYGKSITGNPNLKKTFVLNSLVCVDNAVWLLYAAENGVTLFDDMIPGKYKKAFSFKHKQIAITPLISYNVSPGEILKIVSDGHFFLKIKIGQPGTQDEMLRKDCERISLIHKTIGKTSTPYTKNGKVLYYFDANGRYESKDTLLRFINHLRKIGAYEQVAVIEEPFPENNEIDVHDIELRIAADESAHTEEDALIRIGMGYRAIALKAIAKTVSMSIKIASAAYENNIPCICADLTVSPLLVEWNKNFAARLSPFPELNSEMGLVETNGNQNYKNWNLMQTYSPSFEKKWTKMNQGIFNLDEEFFLSGGGVFGDSKHYNSLFEIKK